IPTTEGTIMKIHQSKLDSIGRTVAITESAATSGGRKYGNFLSLRVVVLPFGMEPAQYRTVAHRGVSVLFAVEADGRSRGERSGYHRAMSAAVAA
ncbi:hypothetical protein D0817_26065, partial [Flavobacterium cupreum]